MITVAYSRAVVMGYKVHFDGIRFCRSVHFRLQLGV